MREQSRFHWIGVRLCRWLFNPRSAILLALIVLLLVSSPMEAPEAKGQPPLTIGVARWRHEGGAVRDVQERTYSRITEELKDHHLTNVSVVRIDAVLKNADEVDSVAAESKVEVVIWGWYDDTAVRGYVDLANATRDDGMTNCLSTFLERGGNTNVIRVLNILSDFDYAQDSISFCVPRWTP